MTSILHSVSLSGFTWDQVLPRFAGVIVLLLAFHIMYNTFFHPISNVPGPLLAKYTNFWLTKHYFQSTWMEDVVQLHKTYGPVVRIAPNEISFVDDAALKELYGTGKPNQKSSWYNTWDGPGVDISFFSTTNRDLHRRLRSRVSGTYSMSAILAMESLISEVMDLNTEVLGKIAVKGSPMRLDEWVSYFTFDVVGQISMGAPIGFLKAGKDVDDIIASIHTGFFLMSNMGYIPGQMNWLTNPVVKFLSSRFGSNKMNAFDHFITWMGERVDERMSKGLGDRRPDMLDYFINAKDSEGQPVTRSAVMMEIGNIVGAGADTTAIGILAILGQLLLNKEAFQRVRDEVDELYANHGKPGFRELEKLPYLSAVIRESTRLHPSITYQLPRVPPPQGVEIAGHHIPKTVTCGISPAAMNRSTELFGEDAAEWVPERWLPLKEGDAEEQKRLRTMEQNLTTVREVPWVCFSDSADFET